MMFKSVFAKYLTAFAVIIIISFLMLSILINSMITRTSNRINRDSVNWTADTVSHQLSHKYAEADASFFAAHIAEETHVLDTFTEQNKGLRIFVTSPDGTILAADTLSVELLHKTVSAVDMTADYNDSDDARLTDLSGILSEVSRVAKISVTNRSGERIGYVFVASSAVLQTGLIRDMSHTILTASVWILLAALIAVFFISDRLVAPLRTMIAASKNFAKGKFEDRVEILSDDEIGQLARAFNQMAESLDRLETMRRSFLANVSHDLRTPMTTIAGFIDGIKSGAIPPEKQNEYLDIISSEIHRLSRLVEQLLNISRIESGEYEFSFENFDICELSRLILISFEQKIEKRKIDVEFATEEDSVFVTGDKDAIHQVLYNLCDNAIKFSAENGLLRIRIARTSSSEVTVSVYNEGAGIPENDVPFVFDRFYKSDKSRGLDKSGLGLGLYISKTIIEAHNGTIAVSSEEGKWCEFSFTLPAGKSALPARLAEI